MSQPRHPRGDGPQQPPDDRLAERLRSALHEQASARPVDPTRLLDDLHARLDDGGAGHGRPGHGRPGQVVLGHARPRLRSGRFTPLLVAAAVLAVVGSGFALASMVRTTGGTNADLATSGVVARHQVDREFSCAQTREVPLDGSQDEFVPDLRVLGDPAGVATAYDAPRYSFTVDGDTATLRLGNADGSLGSVTTYRREDGAWVMQTATACTGAGTPTAAGRTPSAAESPALRLGTGEARPWPAPPDVGRSGAEAVLIDDRSGYTYAGLRGTHQSLYAVPCGASVCFYRVVDEGSSVKYRPEDPALVWDLAEAMVSPDDSVGRANPYQLYVAWDGDRSISELSTVADGEVVRAQRFTHPTWGGARLYALLLPAEVDAGRPRALGIPTSATRPSSS